MTERKVTRVALYARHATPESIEEQLRLCRQCAVEAHYEIVGTYQDEGSANLDIRERPGLRALLEDGGNRKVDVVLMDSVHRLARGNLYVARLFGRFEALGVRIITLDEGERIRVAVLPNVIRRIFDEYTGKGRSPRSTAKRLDDERVCDPHRRRK
jgi:DNA invertase Pin-like site-specific DNA recombinase